MSPEAPANLPKTLAILGTGLLGTSVGLAARRAGINNVVAFDTQAHALATAKQLDAVTQTGESVAEAVASADFVVLAAPVPVNLTLITAISDHLPSNCVVTDVGSTKRRIAAAAEASGLADRFCGSHPMAGSETSGPSAAKADLFNGSTCYLTPGSSPDATARVEAFWLALGCAAVPHISAAAHDALVARVSHLPHAVAAALVEVVGKSLPAGGPGLRDTTRIAAGDPLLWEGILLDNADAVADVLAEMSLALDDLRRRLDANDALAVRAFLDSASGRRRSL